MSCTIYVAAGGGGDAIAAALLHSVLSGTDEQAIVATYAWDRLLVDPLPGPRSPDDFDGLQPIGTHNFEVVPTSTPRPPAGSTLPRLARELPARLMLLDPYGGSTRIGQQLAELADLLGADQLDVVDVGGDALAHGEDPGLRSPLADALALAGAAGVGLPARLLVVGPGLDGELPQGIAQVRLSQLGATKTLALTSRHLADLWLEVLSWHPSEATALWIAAALGMRGRVEIRDSGTAVDLTDVASGVWALDLASAIAASPIARRLIEAETSSLDEVEAIVGNAVGRSELEYERAKANDRAATSAPRMAVRDLAPRVAAIEDAARARGATYVTFRRLAEGVGCPNQLDAIRAWLIQTHAERYRPPLWSVAA